MRLISLLQIHLATLAGCDFPSMTGEHGGGITVSFPFEIRSGHPVTDDPDGHAGRTPHRNWDIDCAIGDPIAAPVTGVVTSVSLSTTGYGHSVCVQDDATGIRVCDNHLDDVFVSVGDRVVGGQSMTATCGNTGYVIPRGNGDGSHLDRYAIDAAGNNVELPHPDLWTPLAVFTGAAADASCEALTPTAAQVLHVGTETTVAWSCDGYDGDVQIDVYRRAMPCGLQLAAHEPADGVIPFAPPAKMGTCDVDGGACDWQLGISANPGGSPSTFSETFCIEPDGAVENGSTADVDADGLDDFSGDWVVLNDTLLCFDDDLITWGGDVYIFGDGLGGDNDWCDPFHPMFPVPGGFCVDLGTSGAYRLNAADGLGSCNSSWANLAAYCPTNPDPACHQNTDGSWAICVTATGSGLVPGGC